MMNNTDKRDKNPLVFPFDLLLFSSSVAPVITELVKNTAVFLEISKQRKYQINSNNQAVVGNIQRID